MSSCDNKHRGMGIALVRMRIAHAHREAKHHGGMATVSYARIKQARRAAHHRARVK